MEEREASLGLTDVHQMYWLAGVVAKKVPVSDLRKSDLHKFWRLEIQNCMCAGSFQTAVKGEPTPGLSAHECLSPSGSLVGRQPCCIRLHYLPQRPYLNKITS